MYKAIFYKEFIKCRRLLTLLLLVAVAIVFYIFVTNASAIRVSGAVSQWSLIVGRSESVIPSFVELFTLLIAISISAMQYATEMMNKRLKLTLHLPCPETKIIIATQLFGILMIFTLYAIISLPLWLGLQIYYPIEIVTAMMFRLLPYMLAGIASYLFVAWIVVEPIWKRRVISLFISIGVLSLFMLKADSFYSYIYATPMLIILVIVSWFCALYSAARFKDGAQF